MKRTNSFHILGQLRNSIILRMFLVVGITSWFLRIDLTWAGNIHTYSKAETWVLKQLIAGKVANLADPSAQLPNEQDRVLSASFLEQVLTASSQSARIHRHGVEILHAVFQEEIDLRNAKVPHSTTLRGCRFDKKVNLSYSVFEKDLNFSESTFAAAGFFDAANFSNLQVNGDAFFNDAQFLAVANFIGSNIAGNFYASRVRFTDAEGYAFFIYMKVGGNAYIDNAEFAGSLTFSASAIAGMLSAQNIRLTNPEGTANFSLMKVGGLTILDHAEFAGSLDFNASDIDGMFSVGKIRFTNPKEKADFSLMKVGSHTDFAHAQFAGRADFSMMKVDGHTYLNDTVFAGGVAFTLTDISGQVDISRARFTNAQEVVMFNGLKVGSIAYLEDAEFAGGANFGLADIAGLFVARGARFTNAQEQVTFNAMRIGSHAIFDKATFAGPTNLTALKVSGHASFDETEIARTINFEFAEIASDFWMERAHLTGSDNTGQFNGMKIGGTVHFKDTEFRGTVNLGNMTYQAINIGDGRDRIESLIAFVNRSRYSAAVYATLEAFFKREGYTESADEVFIAQKTRERHETLHWHSPEYWWNWFSYLFVGYGRKPSYVLVWSALFVCLGYFIFKLPEKMEVQKEEYSDEEYSPFWYSLGLFLPFVNLFAAEVWRPKKDFRWGRIYMRVHALLGWILIPLGLASITGLIR